MESSESWILITDVLLSVCVTMDKSSYFFISIVSWAKLDIQIYMMLCTCSIIQLENTGAHALLFIYLFILICSEFCHTLKWNVLEFTCLPHPDPPSHLPRHPLPPGPPRAPGPSTCLMHPTWAGNLFHPW